jgi:uncharacterized protein YoxC
MTPNEIFFGLITAAIIALAIFVIFLITRLTKTVETVGRLLETTDHALKETVEEVNLNLKNLRSITDNIKGISSDVATFAGSIRGIGDEVKQLTVNVKRISAAVQDLGTETIASVSGLRAGVKTGFEVFLRNLLRQGGAR